MTSLSEVRGLTDWLPGELARQRPIVTVIGDVMLDGWWSGSIERFCREAPAPVVDINRRDYAPGGAANTAMNLAALGARVRLVGLVGDDDAGTRLRSLLEDAGVDTAGLKTMAGGTTTTKYRIVGADQVMLRIDDSPQTAVEGSDAALSAAVGPALLDSSAVVVCDYGTGSLDGQARRTLHAARGSQLLVVDAHDPRPWAELKPDIVTPNAREASGMLELKLDGEADRAAAVVEHGERLLQVTGAAEAVVTLDSDGTILVSGQGPDHRTWARPAAEKQASGAGDTFVACLTLARSAGLPMTTSLDLAQSAADVVVRRAGTSVCTTADLAAHLGSFTDAALTQHELIRQIESERASGRRIVLTNGCFDVLHRGHTRYLNQAKQLGDVLVVALNSDDSVRRLKGPDRPINPAADRAGVIAALSCVDYVTVFDTDAPIPLIEALEPDIYTKGGDYSPQMLSETDVVTAHGGQVRILDYVPERSTSAMVDRIRTAPDMAGGVQGR